MEGLLVCSHRGPVSYVRVDGRIERRQGSGGLVTALSALLRDGAELSWLACALTDTDRAVARGAAVGADEDRGDGEGGGSVAGAPTGLRLLDIPPEVHRRFYDDACVTGLGFLFHGLFDQAHAPTFDAGFSSAWRAYQEVNRAFAVAAADGDPDRPMLVEDYHLMLVAAALRELRPGRRGPLAYFHHVPWCPPVYFAFLPRSLRVEILAGLLAFDTLGFHARSWADEFLACCAAFLPAARCEPDVVRWRDREVSIVVAPAQVDVPYLRRTVAGADAERWRRRMARLVGQRRAVVRVDRVDLWKNIVRGFQAFERLALDRGTDELTFLAVLARSRMHVPQYRRYLAACLREASRINSRLAPGGRGGPIKLLLGESGDHARALAGLSLADVVLVNATSDGLNLVAKESVVAAEGRSGLVLSERTGVYEEIGRWTHGVNPFDIEETAQALGRALDTRDPQPELLTVVERNSPADWLRRRLDGVPGSRRMDGAPGTGPGAGHGFSPGR